MIATMFKLGASMALVCSALVVAAPTEASLVKRDAPSSNDPEFAQAVLHAMNSHRKLHRVPDLTYDDTLASFAQTVSNTCVMKHSGGPYGENLYYIEPGISGTWADGTKSAIFDWIKEIWLYDFQNPEFSEQTGHATACLWKSTRKVGCAWTNCADSDMLTCEFDDAVPNMDGLYEENVLPYNPQI